MSVRMNSCARFVLCAAIGFVTLITVSTASTVFKEFTCDYSTPNGCDGYKVRNLTLMSDGITTIVGKHGTLLSNRMFGIKDIDHLCVEFDFNVYSKLQDDNIQVYALFGMNTTKGMFLYPEYPSRQKMKYTRASKLQAIVS